MPERDAAWSGDERTPHPDRRTIRRYLDDRLEASDVRVVEAHLADCEACGAALEVEEPPVGLPGPDDPTGWDERRFRRIVRRTLLRTAVDVLLLGLAAVVAATLLSWFVWHPLVVDRGGRVADTVQAAADLPMLTVPGAEVSQVRSHPGLLRRSVEADVQHRLGGADESLVTYGVHLGPFGATRLHEMDLAPFGQTLPVDGRQEFEPDRLPTGTSVSVHARWDDPLGRSRVDEMAVGAGDVALEWVGFEAGAADGEVPPAPLGYGACHRAEEVEASGLGSFGMSPVVREFPREAGGGATRALEEARRATEGLVDARADLRPPRRTLPDEPGSLVDRLADDPGVREVVLTGALDDVAALVDREGPETARLIDADLDTGPAEPCG
ncbi:zf-HC2 domain-containing protein [Egibacter rhizosphaerae]|uniref:Zf-HC2 domain-containing protein n=1 Tax=Egibacter rhizosphaerae TaxID=1670831 RepID=A0A411YJ26_9ACTN|nr:zf-HC2 domain-containing protein [Egibacter rhizosphaerae]QBI21082.1 zf-HC2 domain-containing protein [Egibacter rhizosphaerae]